MLIEGDLTYNATMSTELSVGHHLMGSNEEQLPAAAAAVSINISVPDERE